MTDGITSPVSFFCDTTLETVTVTVVAKGSTGLTASFGAAPTTTVLLDGVTSAPAAPTITQSALPIFGGIQFSFAQLTGVAADSIQCYKIYRNTSNNTGTATVVQTIVHDPKNAGSPITFQDSNILASTAYWYWVTAVNTSGLESVFSSAGTTTGNFSIPVETINLFANPSTQGSGNLPAANHFVNEQWQGAALGGSTANPDYRNGRDIRLGFSASGFNEVTQSKSITRFKPGQVVTFSLRLRRDTTVGSPNGTVVMGVQAITDAGGGIGVTGGSTTVSINLSELSGTYKLFKMTTTLNVLGGQAQWFFIVENTSSNCDVYMTEPMLNNGFDAAPFTTNTFLQDVPQYAFEGSAFVSDDFTDPSNSGLTNTLTGHLPSAGGGSPGTGIGHQWNLFVETGSGSSIAAWTSTGNALFIYSGSNQRLISWNLATALSVAYYVQADVSLGSSTGITTLESGVVGRLTDGNNFYMARLFNSSGTITVELWKRVSGTYTMLGTFSPGAVSSGTMKLQMTDAAKTLFWNGTQVISSSDNALAGPGMAGIWEGMNVTSSSVNVSCDNFTAVYIQNVSAPATPPPPPNPPPAIDYDPGNEPALRR